MKIRGHFVASMICLVITLCPVSGAWAARSVAISAFGSYQTYDMADVNDAMQSTLSSYPGSSADKESIESGAGFGGGIRIWTSERVFVSLEFQRLLASNSGSGPYAGSTYTVDLDVPASSVVGAVGYVLLDRRPLRFALAGGAGYYLTTGEFVTRGPGVNDRSSLEGSGFGFHGMGLILAQVARGLDVELAGGYRYAKTTDVTSGGYRIRNTDGSLAQIDWSGFTGRAGLLVRVGGE
ncbi:MAG: hypothetical protein E6K74_01970 [Candidatus Eisenbacteria bacterium]|uniref:Porin family protein n=1 Tax=Eiseniibacteriota bacterium TaxID=2212470 RepID=A0A538SWT8_UNCEI|nr:MAG: hypothetical protein E6K74_01970 [Candidatus Eisenbacteria bacterium]